MRVTAIFESWFVGDGIYDPLELGEKVNLSFYLESSNVQRDTDDSHEEMKHLGDGAYRFRGGLRWVSEPWGHRIVTAVIEACEFWFLVTAPAGDAVSWPLNSFISGTGVLVINYFVWADHVRAEYPAEIFYDLRVARIRKVHIPQRFITHSKYGKGAPGRVDPGDYLPEDVEELESMKQETFDLGEFYILEFERV